MQKSYVIIALLLLLVFQSCTETPKHETTTSTTRYLLTQVYDNADSIYTGRPISVYKFKSEFLDDTLGNTLYYNGNPNNFYTKVDTFEIKNGKKHKAVYSYSDGKYGNLDVKEILDDKGNVIEEYRHRSSQSGTHQDKTFYQYNSKNQLIKEVYYEDEELVYIHTYKYKDGLLAEDFLAFVECCGRQQPVPIDKKIYFYNEKKQKIRECDIIDPRVKRKYKKTINAENYATIECWDYTYDSLGRLKTKCVSYTEEDSIPPNKLHTVDNVVSYDPSIKFYKGVCDSFVYRYLNQIPTNY